MAKDGKRKWFMLSSEEVLTLLASNQGHGLSLEEVRVRQGKYGLNSLKEAPGRSVLSMIIDQIREPLILVLLAAGLISGIVGEIEDTIVILAIVILNTVLGVFQENKAEHSLAALRDLSSPMARVFRGGHTQEIPASELVPGDLILLEAGANVPADARVIEAYNLKCEEAALTGESLPVDKVVQALDNPEAGIGDRVNMLFSGTTVTYGRGSAVVTATGMETEIGKIAEMIQSAVREPTPLQRKLEQLGKVLGGFALALVVIIFFAGLVRGEPIFEMFMTSISLAVAAIPEGLPSIVTIVLALGVQRMIKRNAIIRKLPAVETLGTATVIASDKTGTLTQNVMTVTRMYTSNQGQDTSLLLLGGVLANDAKLEETNTGYSLIGDPTEGALLSIAAKNDLDSSEANQRWKRVGEIPFDSQRKRMTTFHSIPDNSGFPQFEQGKIVAFSKGGPDVILDLCTHILRDGRIEPLTDESKQELLKVNTTMADDALRVLGVAFRLWQELPRLEDINPEYAEHELVFVGYFGMIDPPRPEAKAAVAEAKQAGIRPLMITGDHKATAVAIASSLGIIEPGDIALSGPEIEKMSDEELAQKITKISVFARVSPEHKVRIVDALRNNNQIVAMTGDGVNDAPALKRADIGVAMGITGTDVAKGAADMVLLDDNFATIVLAVREGRTIYANIQKAIQYLLSCNVGEIVAIFMAIMLGLGRPLTAIQILWVNLVTDGLPALALGVEPQEPGLMERPPRNPKAGVFAEGLGVSVAWQGAMIGLLTLGGYYWALRTGRSVEIARTVSFAVLAFSQLFHAFNMRSRRLSLAKVGLLGNKWLSRAFIASGLLQVAVLSIPAFKHIFDVVPIGIGEIQVVVLLSIIPIVLVEIVKGIDNFVHQ